MWNRLTNNIGLKLLAMLFAVILWLIVVNVEDPAITKSFTVGVTFENEQSLTDSGVMYEVLNSTDTIRVTVSASRSIVENLSSSDFSATVDLNDLNEEDLIGNHSLPIYVTSNRYTNRVSVLSATKYVEIQIEEIRTANIEVTTLTSGVPAEGYAVGAVSSYPKTLAVTGPASLVDTISTAVVSIDVTDMNGDIEDSMQPVLYNENGDVIALDKLASSIPDVTVRVSCYDVKEVPIKVETEGKPADGYEVGTITTDKETVLVKGTEQALQDLSEITIDGEELSVEDADENLLATVNLDDYLPYGISLVNESDAETSVEVEVLEYTEATWTVLTNDILVTGLSSNLTAAFTDSTIEVTILAPSSLQSQLIANGVLLEVDLTDYTSGTYEVTLKSRMSDEFRLKDTVTAEVKIENK